MNLENNSQYDAVVGQKERASDDVTGTAYKPRHDPIQARSSREKSSDTF